MHDTNGSASAETDHDVAHQEEPQELAPDAPLALTEHGRKLLRFLKPTED
jgi:hypothetical protein